MQIDVICPYCKIGFQVSKRTFNFNTKNNLKIYCSKTCSDARKGSSVTCNCATCGKEIKKQKSIIKRSKSTKVFCSRSCAVSYNNKLKTGEKHPNYVNGDGSYRRLAFNSLSNKCSDCGNEDERVLEVHHIDENRKNNNIENLVILCANCHKIRHNFNG
jgi:5-methylcytosine-specific restriction endonuclease McrA